MSDIAEKLDLLLNLIEKCQPNIASLQPGLTRSAIAQKTAHLPFEFPEECQLYMWHDGIGEADYEHVDLEKTAPMIFRDHYLSNLDEALETYCDVREYLDSKDYEIIEWDTCFPFADLDGSYYFLVCGSHVLANRYQQPIVELDRGINMMFHSFDSMLDTLIKCYQQLDRRSYERYGILDRNHHIWAKHNPNIFAEMSLHQYRL